MREMPLPERSSRHFAAGLVLASTGVSTRAAQREEFDRVMQKIAAMKEDDREILMMRHVDGLSPAEIADVLDVAPPVIHSRYAKAMIRLKKLCQ